jgi:hypothetical protein
VSDVGRWWRRRRRASQQFRVGGGDEELRLGFSTTGGASARSLTVEASTSGGESAAGQAQWAVEKREEARHLFPVFTHTGRWRRRRGDRR